MTKLLESEKIAAHIKQRIKDLECTIYVGSQYRSERDATMVFSGAKKELQLLLEYIHVEET